MSQLRNILTQHMVGDMINILTPENTRTKTPQQLTQMVIPKVEQAENEIKTLLLQYCEEAKDSALPLTYITKKIQDL